MQIKTVVTARVAAEMSASDSFNKFVFNSLKRHFSGDWGEISENDKETNNTAPLYALGAYSAESGQKIWIKQDCKIVTVLFPDEY